MTIIDLTSALISEFTNIPVFYNHIVVEEGDEINPPYIVTNHDTINPFHADNKTYWSFTKNTVTLYVGKLSERYLKILDNFLDGQNIPFQKNITFDELEMLYAIEYDVSLDDLEYTEPDPPVPDPEEVIDDGIDTP